MSPNERYMAYGVGGVVALLMLFGGYRVIKGGFDAKYKALATAKSELSKQTRINKLSKAAKRQVASFQEKTLSQDLGKAHLDFYSWLDGQVKAVDLQKPRVNFTGMPRGNKDIKELTYVVTGVGDIKQITEFLHRVHTADTLHRVRTIDLQKNKEGLKLTTRIDAISMKDTLGLNEPTMSKVPVGTINENKLAMDLEEYSEKIAMRNIFSPGNEPPRFESLRKQKVELGSDLSGRVKATDPDDDDVYFEFVASDEVPSWLKISESGRLSGRPKKLGEHKVKVLCIDRGIPSKQVEGELTIAVVEPKPEREEVVEDIDESKLAVLTAIVQGSRDPKPQMCMYLRDKDESRYLQAGDRLRVGKWRGTVLTVSTDRNTVLLEHEDDEYELRLGDALSDAKKVRKRD